MKESENEKVKNELFDFLNSYPLTKRFLQLIAFIKHVLKILGDIVRSPIRSIKKLIVLLKNYGPTRGFIEAPLKTLKILGLSWKMFKSPRVYLIEYWESKETKDIYTFFIAGVNIIVLTNLFAVKLRIYLLNYFDSYSGITREVLPLLTPKYFWVGYLSLMIFNFTYCYFFHRIANKRLKTDEQFGRYFSLYLVFIGNEVIINIIYSVVYVITGEGFFIEFLLIARLSYYYWIAMKNYWGANIFRLLWIGALPALLAYISIIPFEIIKYFVNHPSDWEDLKEAISSFF